MSSNAIDISQAKRAIYERMCSPEGFPYEWTPKPSPKDWVGNYSGDNGCDVKLGPELNEGLI